MTGGKSIAQVEKVYLCGVYGNTDAFTTKFSSLVLEGLDMNFTAACFDYDRSGEVRWWVHADILTNREETVYVEGDINSGDVLPVFVHLVPVLCGVISNERELGPGAISLADVTATDVRRRLPNIVWMQAHAYTATADVVAVEDMYREKVRDLCILVGATPSERPALSKSVYKLLKKGSTFTARL